MAALAAIVALMFGYLVSPLAQAIIGTAVLYLLLVRSS